MGAYAVDYIGHDVKQTSPITRWRSNWLHAVDPEEFSQVISVTGSTAGSRSPLLPDQPEKVVFRISYFYPGGQSRKPLRQAVQEAYQAQTPPAPLLGVEVKLYPTAASSGWRRFCSPGRRGNTRPWKIFGKFEKLC